MESGKRGDDGVAEECLGDDTAGLWEVSVLELKRSLDVEIETLEERTGSLEGEKSSMPARGVLPLRMTVSSRIRFLQRMARMSALRKIGGERLIRAERELNQARSTLDEVSAAIDEHNKMLQRQNPFSAVVHFLRNHRTANQLAQRRLEVLRDYRAAEKQLEDVFLWIRDEGHKNADPEVGREEFRQSMAMLYRYRGLEIEHSFLHDELALRRNMRNLLGRVANDTTILVRHRELDKVIRDPLLKSRIETLLQEQKA